jgi:hypothetical protein
MDWVLLVKCGYVSELQIWSLRVGLTFFDPIRARFGESNVFLKWSTKSDHE